MRYQQPQIGPLAIDRGNPITKSLLLAVSGNNVLFDAAGNAPLSASGLTGAVGRFGRGVSVGSSTGTGVLSLPNSDRYRLVNTSCTVFALADIHLSDTGINTIWAVRNTSTQVNQLTVDVGGSAFGGTINGSAISGLTLTNVRAKTWFAAALDTTSLELHTNDQSVSRPGGSFGTSTIQPSLYNRQGGGRGWAGNTYLTLIFERKLTPEEVASLAANPWQIFADGVDVRLLKSAASAGPVFGVAATTASAVGSMAFNSLPKFDVAATTAPSVGLMAFGTPSRLTVTATTAPSVGSMAFQAPPAFGVAAVTAQAIGAMAFESHPAFAVAAQTAPTVGSMAFGPSARLSVSAMLAPAVGSMAFLAQPRFAVVAQTAPTVGSMAFGPSSRLTVAGNLAPTVGAMAFKSPPVFGVAAQTAPVIGTMSFVQTPRFSVAANLASTVGAMSFLAGQVAVTPGDLCLDVRPLAKISVNMRKLGTLSLEVCPL